MHHLKCLNARFSLNLTNQNPASEHEHAPRIQPRVCWNIKIQQILKTKGERRPESVSTDDGAPPFSSTNRHVSAGAEGRSRGPDVQARAPRLMKRKADAAKCGTNAGCSFRAFVRREGTGMRDESCEAIAAILNLTFLFFLLPYEDSG